MCGASIASAEEEAAAEDVGRLLAVAGTTVVCGGLGGVMAAAARGVRNAGGVCVGLLPGDDPEDAAPEVTVALATGMGEMRNALIARACAAMIAIGGGHGTLSEIALALRLGRPVAALATWEIRPPHGDAGDALHRCATPAEAVAWVLDAVRGVGR